MFDYINIFTYFITYENVQESKMKENWSNQSLNLSLAFYKVGHLSPKVLYYLYTWSKECIIS